MCHYLSEDVGRNTCGHEDGAQLLQQTALVHGLLTAGCSSRRVHWGHHDTHQLGTEHRARLQKPKETSHCSACSMCKCFEAAALRYLQHEVEVGDLLRGPARVVVTNFKPGLHSLNVGALLEEVLIGAVVLEQVEQQQQTVLHHNTCKEEEGSAPAQNIIKNV